MRIKLFVLVIATILVVVASQLIYKNINNKNNSDEHFAFLGNPQPMSSLNILDKKTMTFYIASGTNNDKTAIFFISADEIDKASQNIEKIIWGNNLVVELLPEWIGDAKYKLRFRQDSAPIVIFSECQGKTKECYFESMRNLVRRALDESDPSSIAVDQIIINKEDFEIIEAEPKNKPKSRGCFPIHYEIIRYNGDWYTFRTSDFCRD